MCLKMKGLKVYWISEQLLRVSVDGTVLLKRTETFMESGTLKIFASTRQLLNPEAYVM